MLIQVNVLVLILLEWSKMLCGCMRWYLVNKLKGGDLIWSEHYKVGIKKIRHLFFKNQPLEANLIL
jgi:hypothetical protein